MNSRLRRVSLPAAGLLAGVVLAPAAAVAASESFTTSTVTPAVMATSTTAAAPAVAATAKGTGNQAAVLARNYATAAGANAFYSKSYVGSGEHYGIWGVDVSPDGAGVRGQSTNTDGTGVVGNGGADGFGVTGDSHDGVGAAGVSTTGAGVVGSGVIGVVSDGELASFAHLLDFSASTGSAGNLAGTLQVPDGSQSAHVTFPAAFAKQVTAVVTLTPSTRGAASVSYWVTPVVDSTSGETTGFDVHTSASVTDAYFNYIVVGFVEPGTAAPAVKAGRLSRAQAERVGRHCGEATRRAPGASAPGARRRCDRRYAGGPASHSVPSGGTRSVAEAGWPCQDSSTACTAPMLPTPLPA